MVNIIKNLILFIGLIISSNSAFAIDCSNLNTQEKINQFVEKTKETNPLLRNNISAYIEVSPCKQNDCSSRNVNNRIQNIEFSHIIRFEKNKRLYAYKGPNAPQCVIKKNDRDYICNSCQNFSNDACRSFSNTESSTRIKGTNIDTSDFDRLNDDHHQSQCQEYRPNPKYIKIVTRKISGDSYYDIIETYYNKEKEIPVKISYYTNSVLRKVYRFFPNYYIQLDGEWISTLLRVRTTQGDENRGYLFESQVRILKNKYQKHLIYLDVDKDPALSGKSASQMFNIN